jgi:hypothetical protein
MNIFSAGPGAVTAINEAGFPPAALFLEGWNGPAFNSIITGVSLQHQGNVQFMHTMQEFVYLYVFGDRVGDMTVSGVSFSRTCAPGLSNAQAHGLEWTHSYYLANRVALRARPVALVLGLVTVFEGFLVGAGLALNDPQQGLGQFSLKFAMLPPRAGGVEI